jgi:hypothetical protein
MTGHDPVAEAHDPAPLSSPVVHLACTACQLVYEPDLAAFDIGNTGCPRCGGWTWIAQMGASPCDHAPLTAPAAVPCSSFGKETLR